MQRRDVWLFGLLAVILLLGVLYAWQAPKVRVVAPAPEVTVAVGWTTVRLQFSRPVRLEDVAQRVTFAPATAGDWTLVDEHIAVFAPATPWPPGTQVTVTLRPGVRAAGWLPWPAWRGMRWTFTIAPVRLAYLAPAQGASTLYAFDPESGAVTRLTDLSGVQDAALGPQGRWLYLAVINSLQGIDVFRQDLLEPAAPPEQVLTCGRDACSPLRPSPDGRWLVWVRAAPRATTLRLEVLDLQTGETLPLSPPTHFAQDPRWSPLGDRLAYYDATRQGYVVLRAGSWEEVAFLPNEAGLDYTWSADGRALFAIVWQSLPEVTDAQGQPLLAAHLVRYDLATGVTLDLSQPAAVEDAAPVASPNGDWVAFARKYLEPNRWTLGRQLWLMRPDGTQAHPVTQSAAYQHYGFAWGPEGQRLAFVRSNQGQPDAPPEVWVYRLDSGALMRVAEDAYAPLWLP